MSSARTQPPAIKPGYLIRTCLCLDPVQAYLAKKAKETGYKPVQPKKVELIQEEKKPDEKPVKKAPPPGETPWNNSTAPPEKKKEEKEEKPEEKKEEPAPAFTDFMDVEG